MHMTKNNLDMFCSQGRLGVAEINIYLFCIQGTAVVISLIVLLHWLQIAKK